jgi:hypothetical protein
MMITNVRTISLPCTDTAGWSLHYWTYETSSCLPHRPLATVIQTRKYYQVRFLSGGIVLELGFVNKRGFGLGSWFWNQVLNSTTRKYNGSLIYIPMQPWTGLLNVTVTHWKFENRHLFCTRKKVSCYLVSNVRPTSTERAHCHPFSFLSLVRLYSSSCCTCNVDIAPHIISYFVFPYYFLIFNIQYSIFHIRNSKFKIRNSENKVVAAHRLLLFHFFTSQTVLRTALYFCHLHNTVTVIQPRDPAIFVAFW